MSTRISRVRVAAVLLVVLLAGAVSVMAGDRPEPPKIVEEIVAKINGDIVTRGDLAKARAEIDREMKQTGLVGPAAQQQLEKAVQDELRNQIDKFLLIQKGKELDINVDAELNRQIASLQSDSKISDPDKFHEFVRQGSGVSFEDWRLQRKNELITERVVSEEVWRNINIPEAEVL
jgi:peptidyl-prolyl cis-trans isomerase SurA